MSGRRQATSRKNSSRGAGANTKSTKTSGKLLQVHRRTAHSSLLRLLKTPASSLMTTFVIAVSLLLPALLFSLNSNLSLVLAEFQDSVQISLYLDDGLSKDEGLQVSNDLLSDTNVATAVYISRAQALAEFSASTGFADLIQELDTNPLPAAIVVTPSSNSPDAVDALVRRLQDLPAVNLVQLDSRWLQRLSAISSLLGLMGQVLSVIVVLGLFFVVGNTIRLAIENRKDEIRVIKLVGGTDTFIARPFLYTGLFFGLAGGILACILQGIVLIIFNSGLRELMRLYDSNFALSGLNPLDAALLILVGGAVGWLAALLASFRHIAAINP